MEILTITKINTEDSLQRYYNRLLEICMEKEREIDRKIVNCKLSSPRKVEIKRSISRGQRVKTAQTKQFMQSANNFFQKE